MSITVAIPIYNAEQYLPLAIQSVLNQSFGDFELILLDDGSTDNSLAIAKSFEDPRIRVISDGHNMGLPARLNQIVELAKFDLIARMDADDIIPDNRLKLQFDYINAHPCKDLVTTGTGYIDGNSYMGQSLPSPPSEVSLPHMIAGQHGICHASLLVRKSWYMRNQYDGSMARVEDYELWIRAFLNNDLKLGYLNVIGYYYRSDNTLNQHKFITSYKGGLLVANKLPLPFFIKFKFRLKLLAKIVLTFSIFKLGLQRKYFSKMNKSDISKREKKIFLQQLRKINDKLGIFH
ncbi:glycosyltransferase family 2 protein [Shewanella sp. GutCb]|uniref:glycosyltransferase family 2 protein n=1 Tax=Shewanella sp. GutCb TaxID=2058315 RepID=UPI000C7E7647|nr:glycosyltransferase family 2 protein [Shewanella sp. GutCb]PKG75765.1 glycosyltransferase family 2 protein [Shewanella sp. GutCb]